MGNCPTLLKRVCCVQYNLLHPPLKIIMAFESMLLCTFVLELISLSFMCVCVCVCFSKKRIGNCPTLLKRMCCVQYNLPHPSLKITMTFQWNCGVLLCQKLFLSPLCVCVYVCVCLFFLKKRLGNCPTLLKRVCCVQYNLFHPPLKVTMFFEWSCGVPLCQNPFPSPLCVCVCLFLKKKEWVIVPHFLRESVVCNIICPTLP